MSHNTYSVFYIYTDEDNTWRDELEKQLALLVNERFIDTWGKNRVQAGQVWKKEIERELQKADIVLCLISASLFSDEDAMEQLEIAKTVEKLIIPIIIRPCLWYINPILKDLKPLPKNKQAISTWDSKESAYVEVVQELMDIVNTEMATESDKKPLTPKSTNSNSTMTKEEITILIDKDLDKALDALDGVFGHTNGTYNDLANEYFERPDNFNKATYRSKLKRFVKRKM